MCASWEMSSQRCSVAQWIEQPTCNLRSRVQILAKATKKKSRVSPLGVPSRGRRKQFRWFLIAFSIIYTHIVLSQVNRKYNQQEKSYGISIEIHQRMASAFQQNALGRAYGISLGFNREWLVNFNWILFICLLNILLQNVPKV